MYGARLSVAGGAACSRPASSGMSFTSSAVLHGFAVGVGVGVGVLPLPLPPPHAATPSDTTAMDTSAYGRIIDGLTEVRRWRALVGALLQLLENLFRLCDLGRVRLRQRDELLQVRLGFGKTVHREIRAAAVVIAF